MQMKIGVVQLLFVYCITSVFTDCLINFRRTVVILAHKARLVDTQFNPITLAIYLSSMEMEKQLGRVRRLIYLSSVEMEKQLGRVRRLIYLSCVERMFR